MQVPPLDYKRSPPWRISVVTYIELAQGCRDKQELARVKKGLALSQTETLPINTAISERAMQLVDAYALSHGMKLADSLIAATALEHGATILTSNGKHFNVVDGLSVEIFVP